MKTFRSAHASAQNWLEAGNKCLAQLGDIPPQANFGFLYTTDKFAADLANILNFFKQRSGIEHWVGTVGMGICGAGQEYYDTPAVSVLIAEFPADSFRLFNSLRPDLSDFRTTHQDWYERNGSRFAVVHGDPRHPQLPYLINALSEALNGGFLVGGLTSSRGAHAQIAEQILEGGLSGVLFGPDVAVATTLTQGCAPFGETHEISACERNIIMSLDGKPALDVFHQEIGDILARDPQQAAQYIGAALPVEGSDTGDFLVRNIVGMDADNKLLAIGDGLHTGQKIRFCKRDTESAQRDLERMLRELKARLPHAPKGGVYYSCIGRGRNLFGDDSAELKTIQHELGDVPIAGFFCNGEISHNRLYGYTGVLTLFL